MGICISTASSEIHNIEYGPDNLVYYQDETHAAHADKALASLHTHQGSKGPNQDSGILYQGYEMEDGALCAVFDGHGTNGHTVSNFVRNRLPSLLLNQKSSLSKYSNNTCTPNDDRNCTDEMVPSKNFFKWKDACVSAFKLLDKEVKLLENVDCSCSGTTAVVVIRQGEDLVIANLGDSRALLGSTDENGIMAVQLTNDLKPCVPTEADRIRKCNGRVLALQNEAHIQRVWLPHHDSPGLAMSRAFGDFLLKNHGVIAVPDVFYRRLTSNDQFLVLATDGVWDVLSNSEVTSIVWAAKTEAAAANAVVEAAADAWKHKFPNSRRDDCTVVCLFLQKRHHHHVQPKDLSF